MQVFNYSIDGTIEANSQDDARKRLESFFPSSVEADIDVYEPEPEEIEE